MHKKTIFCDETSCSAEGRYRYIYQTARRHVSEDRISNIRRRANLDSHSHIRQ